MKTVTSPIIVITKSREDWEALHKMLGQKLGAEVLLDRFYDKEWYWLVRQEGENLELSGSSGNGALIGLVKRYQEAPICTFNHFNKEYYNG